MRIHTNATMDDMQRAAKEARAVAVVLTQHRSRKRARAFEVKLEGNSRRRPNGGRMATYGDAGGTGYAATWDQWGVFLATVFEVDPTAVEWADDSADAFHARTDGRFTDGWPDDAHGDHKFEYAGQPRVFACTKCTAVQIH